MSFEVTTVNRLAARQLLTQCGVRAEMGRTMSLKALQEHLENFVSLGNITAETVVRELQAAQGNNPQNAGAPWTAEQEVELTEHFRRGMSVASMASIRGRTTGGINARLQKLGLQEWSAERNRYIETERGKRLKRYTLQDEAEETPPRPDNMFYDANAIAAMDAGLAQEKADRAKRNDGPDLSDVVSASATPQTDIPQGRILSELDKLSARVQTVEQHAKSTDGALRKLANDSATLQQTLADTIAAEVKKHQGAWQRFEIITREREFQIEGLAHKAFPKLLRAVSARTRHDKGALNIWLYGPAGTGKSTAARKLAEAFGFAFHTNGPVGSQWDIRGFTDAQGKVVSTAFRRAWEGGGVYCWDEGDGSAPAALIEANGALATGFASFPDKVVQRHADCIVIINGNLRPGAAPDATYNGRYKQDTAFVNRFIAIEWGIDEDLELALLGKLDAIGKQWVTFVRKLRVKVAERGIKGIVVSPRQLQYGIALLDAGAELDEVMEQTVKFMFTDDQWKQVAA